MKARFLGLDPTVIRLASAHFLVDGFGNVYSPLLPLLIPHLGLSLTAAGVLQMFFQLSSSVAQLGFGHLADRWRPRALVLTGPVVAICVLSLVGLASNVWTLGAILVVGGLGGAAFHPPAAALVHRLSGHRKAFGMSVHITGGSLGFSLGPLLVAPVAQWLGLGWTPILIIPGLAALALCLRAVPPLEALHSHHEARGFVALRPYARPLTLLYLIVVLRTLTALSFSTFMPVLLTRGGMPVAEAGAAVAVYLFAASAGGFLGGAVADRWGARPVIVASLASCVPFLTAAPFLSGWALIGVASVGGFLLQSTLPVNVTMGQMIAPVSAATVSSIMMGFAWGTGGLSAPLVGLFADRVGIERALMSVALMPLLAAIVAARLPHVPPVTALRSASPPAPDSFDPVAE